MKKSVSEHWDDIFDKHNILDEIDKKGFFKITANQIKEHKEPRLMTKFDFSKSRPKIFKYNSLSILPIRNGGYIIGKFELYKKIVQNEIEPTILEIPSYFESLDPDNVYSESNALNIAMISGMFEDLIGEDIHETISGRMRTNKFNFKVNNDEEIVGIEVDRSQIEIDAGYESKSKLIIVEAKNKLPKDFIIRQLYYPYRYWQSKVNKTIIPVFLAYENGVYSAYVYKFNDPDNYNSIELIFERKYIVKQGLSSENLLDGLCTVSELSQGVVPFPQANTFNRVKEIVQLVDDDINTAFDISEFYQFEPRQGNYYLAAARYLNLICKGQNSGKYKLTDFGYTVLDSEVRVKNYLLAREILKHEPFRKTYEFYMERKYLPAIDKIIEYISESVPMLGDNVMFRRASTVKGWIQWIIATNC